MLVQNLGRQTQSVLAIEAQDANRIATEPRRSTPGGRDEILAGLRALCLGPAEQRKGPHPRPGQEHYHSSGQGSTIFQSSPRS